MILYIICQQFDLKNHKLSPDFSGSYQNSDVRSCSTIRLGICSLNARSTGEGIRIEAKVDYDHLGEITTGYTGSDIHLVGQVPKVTTKTTARKYSPRTL